MAERLAQPVTAYLDTHIAVWLHDGLVERLSSSAKKVIEAQDLAISPMVLLELQYLYERKRIRLTAPAVYSYLNTTFGISLCALPFASVAQEALSIDWTSDPFDRIIVAQAGANRSARLITADSQIRRHYEPAVW